jgi:Cu+-exporting ATPase
MRKASISIEGMHCATCALTVERSLKAVEGVENAEVSLASNSAVVEYDPLRVDFRAINHAVQQAGYSVVTERTVIEVDDIRCASCVTKIEQELMRRDGVVSANVNLATKLIIVEHEPNLLPAGEIKRAIKDLGYTPRLKEELVRGRSGYIYDFVLSLVLAIPTLLVSMFGMGIANADLLLFALATPVQFIAGRNFYIGAFKSLRHRSPDMNVLVALGTSAAYFYSVYNTFFGTGDVYYEAAALLIVFVLLGRYLEDLAKSRASLAIRKLIELQPKVATVVKGDREAQMPVDEITAGDVLVIRPGDSIPVDGRIIEGKSSIDESMVTGESMPVDRQEGEEVIGGTINKNGLLRIEATRVGKDTFLSQIIRFVEEAQAKKAPIQRFADRVAARFVPAIVAIAALTLVAWMLLGKPFEFSMIMAVSVLVIACPCALGLATPAAIMVGLGKGAEMGILINGGDVLENVRRVDTVVFDKTGTLTMGKPKVVEIADEGALGEAEVLRIAASLESGSEHPLAKAILERAEGLQLHRLEEFESFPGEGVRGKVNGTEALVGNGKLASRFNLKFWDVARLEAMEGRGITASLIFYGGSLVGMIGITDTPKPEAHEAISQLRRDGLRIIMLTGDNDRVAKSISEKLGIDKYIAGVPPGEKADVIAGLQSEGRVVSMVGDGVNDAPALTQADVGIAIGSGSEIAKEAGGIVLTKGDLMGVVSAIRLSKKTMGKIRQNMFWALFYNSVGIPIAAGVLYPFLILRPEIAALAMALSSVSVVANSLTLRRFNQRV